MTKIRKLKTVKQVLTRMISIMNTDVMGNYYLCPMPSDLEHEGHITSKLEFETVGYIKSQRPTKTLNSSFYKYPYFSRSAYANTWWLSCNKEGIYTELKENVKEKKRFLRHIINKL